MSVVANRLLVKGEDATSFLTLTINDGNLSFNELVPLTGDELNNTERYWGSKGDCIAGSSEIGEYLDRQTIDFDCHDEPPIEWIESVANDFPDLEFELVWYKFDDDDEVVSYGKYRIHHEDYEEHYKYHILDDDIIENIVDNDIDSQELLAFGHGRFKQLLDSVGLEYSA